MKENKKRGSGDKVENGFNVFFNKLAWASITAVVSFAALQLHKLSESVAELNKNMTLVVYELKNVQDDSKELKIKYISLSERVEKLENNNGSRSLRARN